MLDWLLLVHLGLLQFLELKRLVLAPVFLNMGKKLDQTRLPSTIPYWHSLSQFNSTFLSESVPESSIPVLLSLPMSDLLTLKQIRDIVSPTQGFISWDFYLILVETMSVSFDIQYQLEIVFWQVQHHVSTPSSRTAESPLDFNRHSQCTCMQVWHVCDNFPNLDQCPYTFIFMFTMLISDLSALSSS